MELIKQKLHLKKQRFNEINDPELRDYFINLREKNNIHNYITSIKNSPLLVNKYDFILNCLNILRDDEKEKSAKENKYYE